MSKKKILYYVKCPHCGRVRITSSKKRVRCFYCGKYFTITPKKKPSRIVGLQQ